MLPLSWKMYVNPLSRNLREDFNFSKCACKNREECVTTSHMKVNSWLSPPVYKVSNLLIGYNYLLAFCCCSGRPALMLSLTYCLTWGLSLQNGQPLLHQYLLDLKQVFPKLVVNCTVYAMYMYSWFSHDITKVQTKKLLIHLSFYFHEVLQHLHTFI